MIILHLSHPVERKWFFGDCKNSPWIGHSIITFSALIIDGYFQFFTGFNILGYPKYIARVSSFFKDKLILGSYLVRLFPLLLAIFLVRRNKTTLEVSGMFILFSQ